MKQSLTYNLNELILIYVEDKEDCFSVAYSIFFFTFKAIMHHISHIFSLSRRHNVSFNPGVADNIARLHLLASVV